MAVPNADASGEVRHYAGIVEIGANVRALRFAGVDVARCHRCWRSTPAAAGGSTAATPTRGHASRARQKPSGDHSALARVTLRGWRRLWLNGGYAYGIESFEDLTRDRIGRLDAHTATGGLRVNLRSLTLVSAAWEHQWRPTTPRSTGSRSPWRSSSPDRA